MGLPKRIKGFRDRAKEQAKSLQDDYEKSYQSKDERGGFQIGSYFDLDILKDLGIEIWRPDIGDHIVDVIPFYAGRQHPIKREGELTYKVDFYGHQRVGPMKDFFICNSQTWRKPCVICNWMNANYIADPIQYKALVAKRRCAYFVWVHDNDEQEEKGLQIFEVSHYFFEKEVAAIAKKPRSGGFVDWTHYDTGKHVFWTIAKSGSFTDASGTKRDSIEYSGFQLAKRDTPSIPDKILAQSFALDEALIMHPDDNNISIAFFGTPIVKEMEGVNGKTETFERLPKKTALERAREQTQEKETVEEEEEKVAETSFSDNGDGEEEKKQTKPRLIKPKKEKEPEPEVEDTEAGDELVCPASDMGGVFGETIEQMDECDECEIWEECSDAQDAKKKSGSSKKLVRR